MVLAVSDTMLPCAHIPAPGCFTLASAESAFDFLFPSHAHAYQWGLRSSSSV
jgi:hypothetical protein